MNLSCPNCSSNNIIKNGLDDRGIKQVYKCKNCSKTSVNPIVGKLGKAKKVSKKVESEIEPTNFKSEFKEVGNQAELLVKSKQIKSLEELILESKIDLKVWKIDHHTINKWDSSFNGLPIPMFQVKVLLSKIVPDQTSIPVIQPIEIKSSSFNFSNVKKTNNKFKKAFIIPDIQMGFKRNMLTGDLNPFHDRRCLSIVLQIVKKLQPEKIILLGDNLDMAEISRFTKTPEFYFTLQPSLIELSFFISQLRLICPNATIQYIEGNHCARLWKNITENALFAYGLKAANDIEGFPVLSVPNLLGLDKLNVEYSTPYPTGEFWINDNLRVSHGMIAKSGSGDSVKEILKNARCSEIFGHVHRLELASKTIFGHKKIVTYTAFSPGCLCKLDGTVPSYSSRENWQNGFGVVDYEEGNGKFQIHPYSINDGVTLFDGGIIIGDEKSYVEQLKKDTNWKF